MTSTSSLHDQDDKVLAHLATAKKSLLHHHQQHHTYKRFYQDRLQEYRDQHPTRSKNLLSFMGNQAQQEQAFCQHHNFKPHDTPANTDTNTHPLTAIEKAYRQTAQELALYKAYYQRHQDTFVEAALNTAPTFPTPQHKTHFITQKQKEFSALSNLDPQKQLRPNTPNPLP